MAERVNQRAERAKSRLAAIPTVGWALLLVLGATGTAVLVAVVTSSSHPSVTQRLVALPSGASTSSLPVRYEVRGERATSYRCVVTAIDENRRTVGVVTDVVPARLDDGRTSTRSLNVPTSHLAVTADVGPCTKVSS